MKKNISYFVILIILHICSIQAQKITFNTVRTVNAELHGFSYVNIYNTCTDPGCFDNVVNLKPRLIRFPSAGDADNYFMNFDSLGYGICFSKVASYLADRYNASSNPLTTPPFTPYVVPAAFDVNTPTLNINASVPAIFSNTAIASTYTTELTTWYNNYRKQQTQIASSYLTLFKQHVKRIEDSLQTGEKVKVIYVANIFSGTPDDLVKTLQQLTSNSITPVDVVGIELSNESWGKKNDDLFPDPNSGDQFYYYVRGMASPTTYTGCIVTKGDFISKIKSNFPDMKIGFPTAPLSYTYYACDMSSSSDVRFNAWNLAHVSRNNLAITVTLTSNSSTLSVPAFDAYVTHNYYDEKYWGNTTEGLANSCVDCLYNTNASPKEYKNYLRAHTTASTNFNHPYAYYPLNDDDTLKESFDCQLKETFKWIDSGYVNRMMATYASSLNLNSINNKKIWTTEWNFHEGTDDTTNIFANTFNQAVLTMGWRMAMFAANWKIPGYTDFLQYTTLFNGVAVQQYGAISKRSGTATVGDGNYDAPSGNVRRMSYWASKLTRHISLDSLNWIDNQWTNFPTSQNLRFYSFIDQSNSNVYLYYINASNVDQFINADSLKLTGKYFDTTGIYREYFSVKNNYSTGGYGTLYEQNKYYKTGPNFTKLFPNDPLNTYTVNSVNGKKQTLGRKSMGLIKYKIQSPNIIREHQKIGNNFVMFPNPANKTVIIQLKYPEEKTYVLVTDILGKTIQRVEMENDKQVIDVSGYANGVYLVRLVSEYKTMAQKLIIAK